VLKLSRVNPFKNPIVDQKTFKDLQVKFPAIVNFPAADNKVKLGAGWLIDQCGWKGYRNSRVGVHNRQALVLVNHSNGSGQDVLALASRIREDVEARFGIALEMEPGVIGSCP